MVNDTNKYRSAGEIYSFSVVICAWSMTQKVRECGACPNKSKDMIKIGKVMETNI